MKSVFKRLFALVMTVILTVALFVPVMQVSAASVRLNKTKIVIVVGQKYSLKLSGTKKTPTWKTSNKKVVTVNKKGSVTGVSKGSANVTATIGKKTYKCKVTVEAPKLSATKKTIEIGDKFTLKLNGTTKSVKWTTSNKKVATVNKNGVVKGIAKGSANIVANVGGKKYTCKVTVIKPRILSVSTNELTITKKGTITVTFKGRGSVYYDIEDSDIVSCKWGKDWEGSSCKLYVTALKYGKTKITITNDDNNEKCVIKVNSNKAHTHKYGKWTITVPATENREGKKIRKCKICGLTQTAAVVTGEIFSRPLSGQSNKVIEYQEYSEPIRKIKIKVKNVVTGENANKLAKAENGYNKDPGNGYTWRFFFIDIEYISSSNGYGDQIEASDIIYEDLLYNTSGAAIGVKEMATLGDKYSAYNIFDVKLYPGSTSSVVFGVLVPKNVSKFVLKVPNKEGDSATWVSLSAPELSSDELFGEPEKPDPVEPDKPSSRDNFNKLKNYISNYGEVNAEGNRFIVRNDKSNNWLFTYGIVYDSAANKLRFIFLSENQDGDFENVLFFDIGPESSRTNVEAITIYYYNGYEHAAAAKAVLYVDEYDGESDLNFVFASDSDPSISTSETKKTMNAELQLGFMVWNSMIESAVGLTLRDMGFVSYYAG